MDFPVWLMLLVILVVSVQASEKIPDRFDSNSNPPQPPQPKFELKDVILFLTPSQIKALEEGKAKIQPVSPAGSRNENNGIPHEYRYNYMYESLENRIQPNYNEQRVNKQQQEKQDLTQQGSTEDRFLTNKQNNKEDQRKPQLFEKLPQLQIGDFEQNQKLEIQEEIKKNQDLQKEEEINKIIHLNKQLELESRQKSQQNFAKQNQQQDSSVEQQIHFSKLAPTYNEPQSLFTNALLTQQQNDNQGLHDIRSHFINFQSYAPQTKGNEEVSGYQRFIPVFEEQEVPRNLEFEQHLKNLNEQQNKEQLKKLERNNKEAQSYSYFRLYSQQQKKLPKKELFFYQHPENKILEENMNQNKNSQRESQEVTLLNQKFQMVPYEYSSQSKENNEQLTPQQVQFLHHEFEKLLKEKENDMILSGQKFDKNEDFLANHQIQEALQYAPNYNQNYDFNLENIIKQIQFEKQLAAAQADAIAKSAPVIVHKDIRITKRRPIIITKHIKVPVPEPFLVPVPQPFEVKVPQPYPVPLEIIRHFPVPIVRTEKVEVEKPVPVEVEKLVPIPVEKKVYVPVDRPYTVERVVPVEVKKEIPVEIPVHKPEKLTIIRHVWDH